MDEINTDSADNLEAMKNGIREVAELYQLTFSTPPGKKVLEHLINMTNTSTLNGNDLMDANVSVSASEFVMMREGHNQVVRFIQRMIKFFKEQK